MQFNLPKYSFSAPLIVEIHKTLSELPAKQSRQLLNAIDGEMVAEQKAADEAAASAPGIRDPASP